MKGRSVALRRPLKFSIDFGDHRFQSQWNPGGGKDAGIIVKTARTRGRPKQDEVGAIESGLLDAALREFVAHGYGGASINRIVRDAGVSKTTLYSRYESKGDLFHAIMQRQVDRLAQAEPLSPRGGQLDLAEGLKAYGRSALEASLEGGLIEVNRLVYSESHRFPELAAAAAERSETGIRQVSDFIARCAVADGIACRNPALIAEMFILMLRGRYVDVMLAGGTQAMPTHLHWIEAAVEGLLAGRAGW